MTALEDMTEEAVEKARWMLLDGEYRDIGEAVCEAVKEVLEDPTTPDGSADFEWPSPALQHVMEEHVHGILRRDAKWDFSVSEVDIEGDIVPILDADECPHCRSQVFNAVLKYGVQFVGSSRRLQKRGPDVERTMFHADDGPWIEGVEYVRCGSCGTVVYDEEDV